MNIISLLFFGALLNWTGADGKITSETIPLERCVVEGREVCALRLSREKILSMDAVRLEIIPEFAYASKGEKGYWFTPYGVYGEFDRDNGKFVAGAERMPMPMFGWSTPRGAYLAIVTSLKYFVRESVTAVNGEYSVAAILDKELCQDPYEDLVIEYHCRPAGTPYAELAAVYRDQQLKDGAVLPFRERFKENAVLEKAIMAPEIRIRQAWKPVPSPILHQTPENEPEVTVRVTFDRVRDIVDELLKQGVKDAELCLVGWNIGGHDGRWPQSFPAEPKLGGDGKLKEAIGYALDKGYLIVPHGNFHEAYTIAEGFDGEITIKDDNGLMLPTRNGTVTWGGGRPYHLCPQRAYEIYAVPQIPKMAAFGFKGLGYFDVVTICEPQPCKDPRHPCTREDGVKYWGACAAISKRDLGGFASESGNDYFAGNLDYSLYSYFGDPRDIEDKYLSGAGIAKCVVPIWEIVYHGIIACNPFTITMNATIKDKYSQLKAIEFGGRPSFYFYSKFKDDGSTWMGKEDLTCEDDGSLAWSVSKIKEGYDLYEKLKHLQLEFITGHETVREGVVCVSYSNGEKIYVNYNAKPARLKDGVVVPASDYLLLPAK